MKNQSVNITFIVNESFFFDDGRTIFCGVIDNKIDRIPPGIYNLVIDGQTIQEIHIENEMIPKKLSDSD